MEVTGGILKRYNHIVIFDVLSRYAEKKSEYASVLFRLGRYDEALKTANEAIEINGDFGMPKAYEVKGMTYFAMKKCPESMDNLEESVRLNPAFDESVAKELLLVYGQCNAAKSKIDKLQSVYNRYLEKKGVKLDKF
jgi:tetratricopeptide (TPR) repeat protein